MSKRVDSGWLPTLVGVLAFMASLLVGRALDWALGGFWGTVASLVLIFGGVAAYGGWRRHREAQQIDLKPHELSTPAPKERWSRRIVAVLLMALAGAVIYGPMYARRAPALKPLPQGAPTAGGVTTGNPTGIRLAVGYPVKRESGEVDMFDSAAGYVGRVYAPTDLLALVYDHQARFLREYTLDESPDSFGALAAVLDDQGRRVGTAVEQFGGAVDLFDLGGVYRGHMIRLPDGRVAGYDAQGNLVRSVDPSAGK